MASTGYSLFRSSIVASLFVALATAVVAGFSYVSHFFAPLSFKWDVKAADSIALDAIGREMDAYSAPLGSRQKSFIDRARTHARWIGDHFDPGRGARLTLA